MSQMASYVGNTGPLSVCVDANNWNSYVGHQPPLSTFHHLFELDSALTRYTGGIMSNCGTHVDHCVQVVGVDTSSYWKVRGE